MNRTGRFRRPALATLAALLFASVLAVMSANPAGAAVSSYGRTPGHANTSADCTNPGSLQGSSRTSLVDCDHNPSLTSRRWQFTVMSSAAVTSAQAIFGSNSPVANSTVTAQASVYNDTGIVAFWQTVIEINPDCTGDGDMTIRVTSGGSQSHLVISIDCDATVTITPTNLLFGQMYFAAHTSNRLTQDLGSINFTLSGTAGTMASCSATPTLHSTSGGSGTLTTSVAGTGASRRVNVSISNTGSTTGKRAWNVRIACAWQGHRDTETVRVNVTVNSLLDSIAILGLDTTPDDLDPGDSYSDSFTTSAQRTRPTCTASDTVSTTTVAITNTRANDIQTNHTLTVSNTANTSTTITIRCTATNGALDGSTATLTRTVNLAWVDERAPLSVSIGSLTDGDLEGGNTATARATATVNRSTASCSLTRTGGTLNVTPSLGTSGTSRSILATVSATGTINFRVSCTHSGASASDTATFTFIDTGGVITPVLVNGLDNAPPDELTNQYTGTGFTTTPLNASCSIAKRSGVGTWRLIDSDRTVQVDSTTDGPTQGRLTCSATDRATTQITIRFSFADPDDDPIGGDTAVTINGLDKTPAVRDVGTTYNDGFSAFTTPSSTVTCTAEKISGTGTFRLSSSRNLQVIGTANNDVVGQVSCSATGFETTEVVVTVPFRPTNTNQGRSVASGYAFLGGKGISSLTQIHLSGLGDGSAVTLTEGWLGGTPPPGFDGFDQHSWYAAFQYENSSFTQYTTSCSIARRSGPSTITYSLPRRAFGQIDTDPPNYYFWTTSTSGAYTTGYTRTARATRNGEAIFRVTCGSGASRSWFDVTVTASDIDAPADNIEGFDGDAQRVIRGAATGSDQVTITPSTRACTARQVGGSISGITPTIAPASGATRTVSVPVTETGTVSVLLTCGTATATAIFTFHGEGESINGLNPASAHIPQRGSATASDTFTVSPGTLQCSANRTGGTLNNTPTIGGNSNTNGSRTVSITSTTEGNVTFTVSCGTQSVPDITFTFTTDDAPSADITSFPSQSRPLGQTGTLTISSRYTFTPSTAVCSVRSTGGTLHGSVIPSLREVSNPNTGEVFFFVTASSRTAGGLELELTCDDDTETATFQWTPHGTTPVSIDGLRSTETTLTGGTGRITQYLVTNPASAICTTRRTGGTLSASPEIQADPNTGEYYIVSATATLPGTIDFAVSCRVGSQTPVETSAVWTFRPAPTPEPVITGFAGRSGPVGRPIRALYSVSPLVSCSASVTGGDAVGRDARSVFSLFGNDYSSYVEISSTGAGSVIVNLTCGSDTESAVFEFISPTGTATNPTLTWTGGSITGTVGTPVRSIYSVSPLVSCSVGAVTGTATGRTARAVFSQFGEDYTTYVEVAATGAGTVIVPLDCGQAGGATSRTFTFSAPTGTTSNPTLTWTGGSITGTVGTPVRSIYSVSPLVSCSVGAVTGTAAGRTARAVFSQFGEDYTTYVEVAATGAGTVIVPLDCGQAGGATSRTFTFSAATGTTSNPTLTWTGGSTTGTVGTPVRSIYSVSPLVSCSVGTVTGNAPGGSARTVFSRFGEDYTTYVEVAATGAGTVIVPLDCSGANARTTANSTTRTFTFSAPTGTTSNSELTWTGGSTTGTVGSPIRSIYSVSPLVSCDATVASGTASGSSARTVLSRFGEDYTTYVEVAATGAGTVGVLLDCSGANARTTANSTTRTFTFSDATDTTTNPSVTWTGGSTTGTVGTTLLSLYTVSPIASCTATATASTDSSWVGTSRAVTRYQGSDDISTFVELTATAAGDADVTLTCGASTPIERTFTFAAETGTAANPQVTWTGGSTTGTVGTTLVSLYTVSPIASCTATVTSATQPDTTTALTGTTARAVTRYQGSDDISTFVEIASPDGPGTVNVSLTCGGADAVARTFTFVAETGTAANPQVTWTGGSTAGTVGITLVSLYTVSPIASCVTAVVPTTPETDAAGSAAHAVTRYQGSDDIATFVEVSATGAGNVNVRLTCAGATPVLRQFTFAAATGTATNPQVTWTGGSTAGTVGVTQVSLYSVEPLVTCTATAQASSTAAGAQADAVTRYQGSDDIATFVEVSATGAGNVNVLLDCSGANARTTANSTTRTFTFSAPTSSAPTIGGFDGRSVTLRSEGTTVTLVSYTVSPLSAVCSLTGRSWTDSGGTTTNNPASGAIAGITFTVQDYSSGLNYITAVEIRNAAAAGSLTLRLTCGTNHKDATFRFSLPSQTVTTAGTATGRPGQELLIGYSTTPAADAASCRVVGITPDPLPDGYTDLIGTVTPAVRVITSNDVTFTVVTASSSTTGTLTATLTCGTTPRTYTATLTFTWSTTASGTSNISGFVAQSGATGRTLQAVFTTDPRELAITCTVAIATQDSGGNTVGLVDNLTDRNAIATATVTVTQPSAVTLPNGNYVWHSVSVTSDTAGVAEVRLSCGTDTADAAFTWAAVGTPESGTVSLLTLRATNTGVLDTTADDNILWLFDWFSPPDNSDCAAETNTDLYTLQLHRQPAAATLLEGSSRNAVLLAFLTQDGFTDADLPSTRGSNERLLIAAFTRHVEAAITVTCGDASKTIRWGARRTGDTSSGSQSVLITVCADDAPNTDVCLPAVHRGRADPATGTVTLTETFTVSPTAATCTFTGGTIHTSMETLTPTSGTAARTLSVTFAIPASARFVISCSAENYHSARAEVAITALSGTRTLVDPPAAPCLAGNVQELVVGALSVRSVPCVVNLVVGVQEIVWYSVLPSDAACVWTVDGSESARMWSIPENVRLAYSPSGQARYLRATALAIGHWNFDGSCTATVVDESGIVGTQTYTVTMMVRAVSATDASIDLPSFGGFTGDAAEFSWWNAVNRLADCFDPSIDERARYEAAYRAYTALLRDLDIKFGYWHWDSFQSDLNNLRNLADTSGLPVPYNVVNGGALAVRDIERYYREVSEAQDRYLDMTDGEGFLSGWVRWVPFIGDTLSQTQLLSNGFEMVKRFPAGFACATWRLIVPDSSDIVNVLTWSLGHRGDGCEDGQGPIEACDQGGLLTWPVEAVNRAADPRMHMGPDDTPDETKWSCHGPDIGSIRVVTGYTYTDLNGDGDTDDANERKEVYSTVGIGSALAWALEVGADGDSVQGGSVSVVSLLSGTAGDGSAGVYLNANGTPARAIRNDDGTIVEYEVINADGTAHRVKAWGRVPAADGQATSVLFSKTFGGHWFSTCPSLHANLDQPGSDGVWGRLWNLNAFSAIMHALVLLTMALLLYRSVRLLIKEIGKNSSSGGGGTP